MGKLSKWLTWIAGEYFVAWELSLRWYMASITLRNNDSIDIHASKLESGKTFSIQVKTNQNQKRSWILSKKSETISHTNMFYIFVCLKDWSLRPDYFIVPSYIVANFTKVTYWEWFNTPWKNWIKRQDTNMRIFQDYEEKYLEKWELLNL